MQELTDLRVKIIMEAYKLASEALEEAEMASWRARREGEKLPDADMDVWIMYDVPSDAFNMQFWFRSTNEVARQPMLCSYHHEAYHTLSLFTCTCADMPEESWEWGADLEDWRLALTALREWTMKPRREQIANTYTNCGGKGECDVCLPKDQEEPEDATQK